MGILLERQNQEVVVPVGWVIQDGQPIPWWWTRVRESARQFLVIVADLFQTGMIVKYSILAGFFLLTTGFLVGSYIHARMRMKKGLDPLGYHRVRSLPKSSTRRLDEKRANILTCPTSGWSPAVSKRSRAPTTQETRHTRRASTTCTTWRRHQCTIQTDLPSTRVHPHQPVPRRTRHSGGASRLDDLRRERTMRRTISLLRALPLLQAHALRCRDVDKATWASMHGVVCIFLLPI
jgi:hypothetical protein